MRRLLPVFAASLLLAISVVATSRATSRGQFDSNLRVLGISSTSLESTQSSDPAAEPTPTEIVEPAAPETPVPPEAQTVPSATRVETAVIPDTKMAYYDIQGRAAADLRQQMTLYGPLDTTGTRWDALMEWSLSWKWTRGTDGSGACRVTSPSVAINSKVTFPRWLAPDDAQPDLVAHWMAYTRALAQHEGGHVTVALDAVPYVEGLMKKSSCDKVQQTVQAGVQHIRDLEDKYESATDHGRTQGALFP